MSNHDELDFSKLRALTAKIEQSDDDEAIEELAKVKSDHAETYSAAEGGNGLAADNDLAIAEHELEEIIMIRHLN
jgi:hypothetical protein